MVTNEAEDESDEDGDDEEDEDFESDGSSTSEEADGDEGEDGDDEEDEDEGEEEEDSAEVKATASQFSMNLKEEVVLDCDILCSFQLKIIWNQPNATGDLSLILCWFSWYNKWFHSKWSSILFN